MASYDDILSRVYEVLGPFNKKDLDLTENTNLVNDLGLDSLKVMDLLTEVEDQFDISIPLNILPEVHTVKDLVSELHKLTGDA